MPRGRCENTSGLARDRCGLYFGLPGRIQKLKEWTDPLGPSGFVVFGAFDALVVQVAAELPAFLQKHVAKLLHVLHDPRAFARADVEPDHGKWIYVGGLCETMHYALVPPDGRGERGNPSKYLRKLETQVQRYKTSERRTANPSFFRTGKGAVFAFDEGLHFF